MQVMFTEIATLLSSAGLGGVLKIVSALAQSRIEEKRRDQEIRLREIEAISKLQIEKAKFFYGEDNYEKMGEIKLFNGWIVIPRIVGGSAGFTRWTRRLLAFALVGTYCYLLLLWGANPDVEIAVWNPSESGTVELFWGIVSFPSKTGEIIRITAGSLVWGMTNVVTMVLTAYFMPIGNK